MQSCKQKNVAFVLTQRIATQFILAPSKNKKIRFMAKIAASAKVVSLNTNTAVQRHLRSTENSSSTACNELSFHRFNLSQL